MDLRHEHPATIGLVIESAELEGYGGDCGQTALILNEVVFGGRGEIVGAANRYLLDEQDRFVGHVAVRYDGHYYDARGYLHEEDLVAWGMLDPEDPDYWTDAEIGEHLDEIEQGSASWNIPRAEDVDLYVMDRDDVMRYLGGTCFESPEAKRRKLQEAIAAYYGD